MVSGYTTDLAFDYYRAAIFPFHSARVPIHTIIDTSLHTSLLARQARRN